MLHLLLYGLLAIGLAGGLFALAARFLPAGEQIAPPLRDEPPWELPPDRALQADDIDAVRLPVALRGYRFAETDILLDRLAGELRARDEEIARLRGEEPVLAEPPVYAPPDPPAQPFDPPVYAPPEPPAWAASPPPWAVGPAAVAPAAAQEVAALPEPSQGEGETEAAEAAPRRARRRRT